MHTAGILCNGYMGIWVYCGESHTYCTNLHDTFARIKSFLILQQDVTIIDTIPTIPRCKW